MASPNASSSAGVPDSPGARALAALTNPSRRWWKSVSRTGTTRNADRAGIPAASRSSHVFSLSALSRSAARSSSRSHATSDVGVDRFRQRALQRALQRRDVGRDDVIADNLNLDADEGDGAGAEATRSLWNVVARHTEAALSKRNRRIFLWSGTFAGMFSFLYTTQKLYLELQKPVQLDSSLPSSDSLSQAAAAERKVVPTGNTTCR
ncbi:hypothetical protein B0T18DRAFT_489834 [Schizothecium vesticola]|uniref:Uncharacterized protein n=1 Tax=Schizothecium vesticola TaxID=314040 RepID=A0AA40EP94_9PEZI|nr:hypothetical protein B0T18DRAFT_489834 [Schizothecium vesticola]